MQFDSSNDFFEAAIYQSTGQEAQIKFIHFVTGGSINQTVQLETTKGSFFLKWNEHRMQDAFEKEAKGLLLLRSNTPLKVPEVLGVGSVVEKSYLLLEFIDSHAYKKDYWIVLGEGLALLHGHTQKEFGLDFDNYIGTLPQHNTPYKDWLDFFIEKRVRPQFGIAYYRDTIDKDFYSRVDALHQRLQDFFPKEVPSLLHGDLWSGNVISSKEGQPCILDPAVYYGHREMELAFTKLFGGFPQEFYDAYTHVFPLAPAFEERVGIYNIYPLMVHVNLFGTSYLSGVDKALRSLGV